MTVTPEMKKFQRKLMILVLIPTVILLVVLIVGAAVLREADQAREAETRAAQTARVALAQETAKLAFDLSSSSCLRGNVVRAYLRYRAQNIEASGNRDLARRLFPIQNCEEPADKLSAVEQQAEIARIVREASR